MRVLLLSVDGDQLILAAAKANFLSVFDGVDAVTALDALFHGGYVVVGRLFLTEYEVNAGLVEGHGVGAGENAHILECHRGGIAVTVAVDAHVVHHSDVDNLTLEIVVHCSGSGGHALEKFVLVLRLDVVPEVGVVLALSVGVDVGLAVDVDLPVFQVDVLSREFDGGFQLDAAGSADTE